MVPTTKAQVPTARAVEVVSQKLLGTLIQWKLGQLIGSGAHGEVYKAMVAQTGQLMAVKRMTLIKPTLGLD